MSNTQMPAAREVIRHKMSRKLIVLLIIALVVGGVAAYAVIRQSQRLPSSWSSDEEEQAYSLIMDYCLYSQGSNLDKYPICRGWVRSTFEAHKAEIIACLPLVYEDIEQGEFGACLSDKGFVPPDWRSLNAGKRLP